MGINFGTEYDVTVLQGNDPTIAFTISAGPIPYNLTGLTLTFYLKASDIATDGSGYNNTPTVVQALLGQLTVTIPHAQLAAAGTMFYHIDANSSGSITTLVFGNLNIIPV